MNARLCILSSSSRGNCSVLLVDGPHGPCAILVDLGLSPRRTRKLLSEVGASDVPIAAVILTHLDDDHYRVGWPRALAPTTRVFLHRNHRGRASRAGLLYRPTEVFDGWFSPMTGVEVEPLLVPHDELGSVALRFRFGGCSELGYATDVGRATQDLVGHLKGVDVLAIESNYCPKLQLESGRPEFLKHRVMGGKGHLSNQQSAAASERIGARNATVLLHLSQECNTPDLARSAHASYQRSGHALVVSHPDAPTCWLDVCSEDRAARPRQLREEASTLWEHAPAQR